jgi:tetratricopeptide (TPR) repeat protein
MRMFAWSTAVSAVLLASLTVPLPLHGQEKQKFRPRDIPRLMEEADKFIAANDLPKAEAYLKTIIELDPRQSQAAFKLGKVCEAQQDWDCALTNYQLALGALTGPEKAQAHLGMATGHLRAERYTDAAEHAKEALAADPSLSQAHVIQAEALVRLKSPDAAAAAEAAAKAVPDSAAAHAAHGEALLAAGKDAEAEAPLRRALELDPKRAATSAQLAQVLSAKGDHDGTIAAVTAALTLEPGRRELFALRGKAHLAKGDEAQALEDLHAAVAVSNVDANLHLALASIHHKHGRLDVATQHYRSAIEIDPQVAAAQLGLADVLVRQYDFEGARTPIERAAGMLPDDARAQYLLGRMREHDKQFDGALEAYAKAVSLDDTLPDAHHARGRILREQKKDTAGGLASLEKAAALDTSNAAILTDLGAALYEAKQVDRTIETLQKVVVTPDYKSPMGYGVLGLALKDKGDYAQALTHLDKAIELEPKWWMPYWGAAWAHFGSIKKGCPCGPEDEEHVKKMQALFEQMTALGGADPALAERVKLLAAGQKIR